MKRIVWTSCVMYKEWKNISLVGGAPVFIFCYVRSGNNKIFIVLHSSISFRMFLFKKLALWKSYKSLDVICIQVIFKTTDSRVWGHDSLRVGRASSNIEDVKLQLLQTSLLHTAAIKFFKRLECIQCRSSWSLENSYASFASRLYGHPFLTSIC